MKPHTCCGIKGGAHFTNGVMHNCSGLYVTDRFLIVQCDLLHQTIMPIMHFGLSDHLQVHCKIQSTFGPIAILFIILLSAI
jgi:hypothetical protein